MKPVSLRTHFTRLLLPSIFAFLVVVVGLFTYNDYKVNEVSRTESENLIAEIFVSAIKQPLLQGSFIEATIRSEALLKNEQVSCVEIFVGSDKILDCKKKSNPSGKYHVVARPIFFSESDATKFGEVIVHFDNSDLITHFKKSISKWTAAFALLGVILFFVVSIGLERINAELRKLLLQAQGATTKVNESRFRIEEFLKISEDLREHMGKAAIVLQARASLEIAQQVAHDIRSPISGLIMLLNDLGDDIPQSHKSSLEKTVQRIRDIASDLVERHKIQDNDSEIISLNETIKEIISEKLQQYSRNRPVEISLLPSDDSEIFVKIGSSDLKRVLSNLIDNSVEAFSESGNVTVSFQESKSDVLITISDNGKGIAQDVLPKLFQKGASFGKQFGKGLGLYGSKQIVLAAGGSIHISSTLNQGTSVEVILPRVVKSIAQDANEKNDFGIAAEA